MMMQPPHHPFRSQEAKEEYIAHYDARAAKLWPVPSESKYVETSYGKTFVRISGPLSSCNDEPPLVLLHGDSENSLSWIQILKAGLSTNLCTFAVDHIYDNGRSVCTRPMTKPADFVEWLDELVTALLLLVMEENNNTTTTRVNLMGHSYGGWQAALYAAAHPDRVNRLILLAPLGVLRPRPQVLIRAIVYGFCRKRSIVKRYLYWYAPVAVQKNDTRQVVDEMVEEDLLAFKCYKRRKFVLPTLLTKENCWNALMKNNNVPTLCFIGDHEVTYSPDRALRHLAEVDHPHFLTAVKVVDADHHIALVQPEIVNNAVQKFLLMEQEQG